jgi:hypothetical protein
MIEDAIAAHLGAASLPVGTRIYRLKAPQNPTQPYIVLYRISVTPGGAHTRFTLDDKLIQISIFGTSQTSVLATADALKDLLHNYRGDMGEIEDVTVMLRNERTAYNDVTGVHHVAVDYAFKYKS